MTKIIGIIILRVLVFFKHLALVPQHIGSWLGDHFQWYRKWKGGTWLQWTGFWEKVQQDGSVYYKRGLQGFDMAEGLVASWDYHQILHLGDSVIQKVEDYTGKEKKAT
jgi:hypothetical protein